MKYRIVTNNPTVFDKFGKTHDVAYHDVSSKDILRIVSDYVKEGYSLLNHPLYGSVKPNETPYRTILIAEEGSTPLSVSNDESSKMMFKAKTTFEKFTEQEEISDVSLLEDYQVVDLALATSAVDAADR